MCHTEAVVLILRNFFAMESLKLWIKLSPEQLDRLNRGNEVVPDDRSRRYGFRMGPMDVGDSARFFLDWAPGVVIQDSDIQQRGYAVMEMEISALGYLQKMEDGVLERPDPTVYRWHGSLRHEARDSQGRLLYCVSGIAEGRFL